MFQKGKSEKELAALRQEMHILASLTECAYVIRMLDWFETASEICVVTEYAQGELFEILEDDTALPEETVKRIAVQLVAGLRYLHAHRIIHRDMKPVGKRGQNSSEQPPMHCSSAFEWRCCVIGAHCTVPIRLSVMPTLCLRIDSKTF